MEFENKTIHQMLKDKNLEQLLFTNKKETEYYNFEFNEETPLFVLDSHLNDLVPLKHFYKEFSEPFLCYMNNVDLRNIFQYN